LGRRRIYRADLEGCATLGKDVSVGGYVERRGALALYFYGCFVAVVVVYASFEGEVEKFYQVRWVVKPHFD
jgi:hypothetical protein